MSDLDEEFEFFKKKREEEGHPFIGWPDEEDSPKDSEEKEKEINDDEEIIYVKDRPLWRIVKIGLIIFFAWVFILFVIGFIIGLNGGRTPMFDTNAVYNIIDKFLHPNASPSPPSELIPK